MSDLNRPQPEIIIESSRSFSLSWRELWEYRELFYFFAWRDVKIKYKQTFLGVLWVVLQPVLSVVVFSLFFGRALQVPSAGLPYPVFVFSGLLLWNFFSGSVNTAGNSMLTNATMIKKIYFPRLILPIASVLVSLVDFFIAFLVFLVILIYYSVPVDYLAIIVCWPLALILLMAATVGISCWLSAMMVKYRDFRYVIPFSLQILLFLSPVIYPGSIIKHPWLNHILAINPVHGAINLFRMPLTGQLESNTLLVSCASALMVLLWGIYYFKKTESFFADIA